MVSAVPRNERSVGKSRKIEGSICGKWEMRIAATTEVKTRILPRAKEGRRGLKRDLGTP